MDTNEARSLLAMVPPHWRVKLPSANDPDTRVDAGAFSATIKPYGGRRYHFNIRAENHDQPTIYGYGMSLRQAFRAAAELLGNLSTSRPRMEDETIPRAA